jgi:AAA domain/Winged helix-turn-helix DNA-binding
MALKLISWSELTEISNANPLEYFWGQCMQAGTFNILAGSPKAGKSSFVRDLASCVLIGSDFLGRKVKQSDGVLYITTEEDGVKMHHEMESLKVGGDVLEKGFYLSAASPDSPARFVDDLRDTLKENPAIKFVVLDTLVDFLPGVNVDSQSDLKPALRRFVILCGELKVTILALHHDNRHGKTLLDMVSGSRAFTGMADTIMGIYGSMNSKRSLETGGRCKAIPRTRLYFDEEARKFSLGESVGVNHEGNSENGESSCILKLIENCDGITQPEIIKKIGCSPSTMNKVLKDLEAKDLIHKDGRGRSRSPFVYRPKSDEGGNWDEAA